MFIRKNVSGRESIARFVGGGLMVACGLLFLHATPLGLAVAAVGVVAMLTGALRYCPACAILGRKPEDKG